MRVWAVAALGWGRRRWIAATAAGAGVLSARLMAAGVAAGRSQAAAALGGGAYIGGIGLLKWAERKSQAALEWTVTGLCFAAGLCAGIVVF